jgi:hypothetical protein
MSPLPSPFRRWQGTAGLGRSNRGPAGSRIVVQRCRPPTHRLAAIKDREPVAHEIGAARALFRRRQ